MWCILLHSFKELFHAYQYEESLAGLFFFCNNLNGPARGSDVFCVILIIFMPMNLKPAAGLILVLLIVAFPLFGCIGYYPIRLWDESRVAINAYEMSKTGNWIVTTFDWGPDMWNTKPPLLIWIQVLFIKLFGLHDLSIRMVSPLAALATCIFLYWFFIKNFSQPWLGVLVCFILVTSQGYVRLHGTRSGEYDSLMVMFTTMYALYYFLYLEDGKTKYLYASAITLTLAVLTKGIAALLFLPALFVFTLSRGQLTGLFRNIHFYAGVLIFFVFGVGYYLLREHYNHGFIEQVRMNEFGGRYLQTDRPGEDILFYYRRLETRNFIRWLVLMAAGVVLGIFSRNKLLRRLTLYSVLTGFSYFIIVSFGQTKNEWYDMACYPFFAIITAAGIYILCRAILAIPFPKRYLNLGVTALFIILICWLPYTEIVKETLHPTFQDWSQENDSISFYIRDVLYGKRDATGLVLANEGYQADVWWYQIRLAEKGKEIPHIDYKAIPAGKKVIAFQQHVKEYIATQYDARVIDSFNTLRIYQVNGTKQ